MTRTGLDCQKYSDASVSKRQALVKPTELRGAANGLTLNGVLELMARTRSQAQLGCIFGGAVAQLGERLVRNEEVRGSTPLGSTRSRQSTLVRRINSFRAS